MAQYMGQYWEDLQIDVIGFVLCVCYMSAFFSFFLHFAFFIHIQYLALNYFTSKWK